MKTISIKIIAKSKNNIIAVAPEELILSEIDFIEPTLLKMPINFLQGDYKMNKSYDILISEKQFESFVI